MYKRFKWNPEIRLDLSVFDTLPSEPSRIFVGSTIELFHEDISDNWRWGIFEYCKIESYHTFIFLTKKPENLIKWSPFPDNCWVGVSATNYWKYVDASNYLSRIEAPVKFLSFEPLLSWDKRPQYFFKSGGISWLIIGQQAPVRESTMPKIEWITEIVEAADKAGVPVFLKDNLKSLLWSNPPDEIFWDEHIIENDLDEQNTFYELRQEYPGRLE